MPKFMKTIAFAALALALLVSMQITVLASVGSSEEIVNSVSSAVESEASIMPYAQENVTTTNESPNTGVANLAIPGIVAVLAAATAATVLVGKKK